MSRQVDVKALVSHIVRGDGADRCRICLGDTSEGQVYLGDTVMRDADRAVTLAELLETIAGVQVPLSEDLPSGLCCPCLASAMAAAAFRTLCRTAAQQWDNTLQLLSCLPSPEELEHKTSIFAIITNNQISFLDNETKSGFPFKFEKSENESSEEELVIKPKRRNRVNLTKLHCRCPDCGKKFFFAQHLYTHLKESTDYKRSCYICTSIMSRDELIQHIQEVHQKVPYDCKKCPALLQSLRQYKQHLDTAHAPGAYSCGDCGRSFQSANAFHGHLSMHAAKSCPGCDKLFRNHRCYVHHVKKCCNLDKSREDAYMTKKRVLFEVKNNNSDRKVKVGVRGSTDNECTCDYCGKTFAGKKFVCAHIQIVHLKNTHKLCPYCGKSLAAAHMTQHMKKHENLTMYRCEHCAAMFKSKLGYIQHLRLHTGEKPYTCKYCSESFSASSRRSEHVRKMHRTAEQNILKHACELCPARFRLPYRLKKHMLAVHEHENSETKVIFECPDCLVKFSSCRGLLHHSRKHQTFTLAKAEKKYGRAKVFKKSKDTGKLDT